MLSAISCFVVPDSASATLVEFVAIKDGIDLGAQLVEHLFNVGHTLVQPAIYMRQVKLGPWFAFPAPRPVNADTQNE